MNATRPVTVETRGASEASQDRTRVVDVAEAWIHDWLLV